FPYDRKNLSTPHAKTDVIDRLNVLDRRDDGFTAYGIELPEVFYLKHYMVAISISHNPPPPALSSVRNARPDLHQCFQAGAPPRCIDLPRQTGTVLQIDTL